MRTRLQLLSWFVAVVVFGLLTVTADLNANVDTKIIEEEVDATLSAALSGCGLCQQTGYCDQAFRGTPGQFCQTLMSGAPCCCPLDAQCVANAYSCRCRRTVATSHTNSGRTVTHTTTTTSTNGDSKSPLLILVLILLCCVCCCWSASRSRERQAEYTAPVYVSSQYGATAHSPVGYQGQSHQQQQYSYAYPSAPPAYETPTVVVDSHPYSTGNTVAAGAAGAFGGLTVGAILGSLFGGGHGGNSRTETTETTYFSGDSGFDTTTYEFSGDTGGGDFDGNETFAGDS